MRQCQWHGTHCAEQRTRGPAAIDMDGCVDDDDDACDVEADDCGGAVAAVEVVVDDSAAELCGFGAEVLAAAASVP